MARDWTEQYDGDTFSAWIIEDHEMIYTLTWTDNVCNDWSEELPTSALAVLRLEELIDVVSRGDGLSDLETFLYDTHRQCIASVSVSKPYIARSPSGDHYVVRTKPCALVGTVDAKNGSYVCEYHATYGSD